MSPVLVAKLKPEDVYRTWEFLVSNYPLAFIIAGAISFASFVGLIFMPAIGSYGRAWEKVAAGFLSLFVLATMLVVGTGIGLYVFYHSDNISISLF
jgi:hypothetical protein